MDWARGRIPSPSLAICGRSTTWPRGLESGRHDTAPHSWPHSGADSLGKDAGELTLRHESSRAVPIPIICRVVSWVRERCPSSLASCHLWQVRELALGSQEWESWPCSILATAYERAGPALLLGSTLEMTLLVELQVSGSCELESRKVAP